MKNGQYNLCNVLKHSAQAWCSSFLVYFIVTCFIIAGCRSSRNMVQETETVEHNEFSTFEKNESVYSEANDSICQRDTTKGGTRERGRIDIERDTAGRPVVILWAINSNFSAEASTEKTENGFFMLRRSSNNAEASGSVDSLTQKKEEAQAEINPAIPLESLIGFGFLLLVIFYVIFTIVGNRLCPWLKNRCK